MPLALYCALRASTRSRAVTTASPIGVPPLADRRAGSNCPAVANSCTVRTPSPPKVTTATSTRWRARASPLRSAAKACSPSFSALMARPDIEPETSSSSTHAQRGSGLVANSTDTSNWVLTIYKSTSAERREGGPLAAHLGPHTLAVVPSPHAPRRRQRLDDRQAEAAGHAGLGVEEH